MSQSIVSNIPQASTFTELTASSGTYYLPAGCIQLKVRYQGDGGGGGGANTNGSGSWGAGGGGGGGGYGEGVIDNPSASYEYTVGQGGTAGAAGNHSGGTGSGTTFGTSLFTANGGVGGGGGAYETTDVVPLNGGLGGTSTGGSVNIQGQYGLTGWGTTAIQAVGGTGGDSILGFGCPSPITFSGAATNPSPTGYGGGGAGGAVVNNGGTPVPGIAGAPGIILIEEIYG